MSKRPVLDNLAGGLIGAKCAWGDTAPTNDMYDFGRFSEYSLRKMKTFPPNDYGLYAMCGGVWEWVSDWYDAEYYAESGGKNPLGLPTGTARVLRGGSWADEPDAVTVSFRATFKHFVSPNIGFRLWRVGD